MSKPLLRTDREITDIFTRHGKTVYRVCFAFMKNPADTEDAVQDTFYQLIQKGPAFESEEHEKAWLIRTASNICKNSLKHWWRKREDIDEHTDIPSDEKYDTDGVFGAVTDLPAKYRAVVYLYYYEGYTSTEIAEILGQPQSTVRNHLREARMLLKEKLGDDLNE